MPGLQEFAQIEARILRMTNAELVEMALHPEDYESWALDIGRSELARRKLAPEAMAQLATDDAAEAAALKPPPLAESLLDHLLMPVMLIVGFLAFPAYFVLARRFEKAGDVRLAKKFLLAAYLVITVYVGLALVGLLWVLGLVKA